MMKKISGILLILIVLLTGACKFFRKSSTNLVDTLVVNTESNIAATPDTSGLDEMADAYRNSALQDTPAQIQNHQYYMIVGCFVVPENADRYAERLRQQGYNPTILQGRDNFRMVSAKSYPTLSEGVSELAMFRTDVSSGAWVHIRR